MIIKEIEFFGWKRNLLISNGDAELIVTIEVGPRVLSYSTRNCPNLFYLYPDQLGICGGAEWRNRGGHRLWLAPEERPFTYFPDNSPVNWERLGMSGVRLTPPPETANGVQKQLDIIPDASGNGVTVIHRVTALRDLSHAVALWALTVMKPGGIAMIPQPALGEHSRDLLPNRKIAAWSYTDLSDPRLHFDAKFITLRQDTTRGPIKIGFAGDCPWMGYRKNGSIFIKKMGVDPSALYSDMGCNLEVFSNAKMLELESLAPLTTMRRGASAEHVERWALMEAKEPDLINITKKEDDGGKSVEGEL